MEIDTGSSEGSLGESQIIRIVRELARSGGETLRVPMGDDAAVAVPPPGLLLMTADMLCEGVHFSLKSHSFFQLGWKATIASLSDVAAMGGEPLYCLLSAGFQTPPDEEDVTELISGVLEALQSYGGLLVGGDTTRTEAGTVLAVTIIGSVIDSRAITRAGAQIGDIIGVTGNPGRSACGLLILDKGDDALQRSFAGLVDSHLEPHARVGEGMLLAREGVNAMEDISDGLTVELGHICEESSCGCLVDAARVPIAGEVADACERMGSDALEVTLGGGEDYELLFTCDRETFDSAKKKIEERGTRVTAVGEVTEKGRGLMMSCWGGETELEGYGYEHFR